MRWTKKGLIIEPQGQCDWIATHASVPFAMHLEGNKYRIYFGSRNKENKTQPGYIEIDIRNPSNILYISPEPILKLGDIGCFDDSALICRWIIETNGLHYMYYTGWEQGINVPYYAYIGLAVSKDGGKTFERFSKAPIVGRDKGDPYLTITPCVLIENRVWRMWYGSGVTRQPETSYHIKYAESKDGIHWIREGIVCIDFQHEGESRISRPCVIKENQIYKMWYSYAIGAGGYQIGYAESQDGIRWTRKDGEAGIDVSKAGWDSEMICYPFVFEHEGKKYMLYNGNGYGKTGFGYAILEEE